MTNAVSSQPVAKDSLLLFTTWFDAGSRAFTDGDYESAADWLAEALNYVVQGGPLDLRHAEVQATLAYARILHADQLLECLNDPCTTSTRREAASKSANLVIEAAFQEAGCALPRLTSDSVHVKLARGRAAYALGRHFQRKNEVELAASHYAIARAALDKFEQQSRLLEDVLKRSFELAYRQGEYSKALTFVVRLEASLLNSNGSDAELAWSLACQADMYLQIGSYREAYQRYHRWLRFQVQCQEGQDCSVQCAYAHSVFGRVLVILGRYDEARRALIRGREIFMVLVDARRDPPQRIDFEATLALAELERRSGNFYCAHVLLGKAERRLDKAPERFGPYEHDCRVRLRTTRAKQYLSLGQLCDARREFQAALKLARESCAARYTLVVPALVGLARVDSEQSRVKQALLHVKDALCVLEQAQATSSAEQAWTLHELAYAYFQDNKVDEAVPACDQALLKLRAALCPEHPDEALIRWTSAQASGHQHHAEIALAQLSRVQKALEDQATFELFHASRALRARAEICHARRHLDGALELFQCALRTWQAQEQRLGFESITKAHPEKALLLLGISTVLAGQGQEDCATRQLAESGFYYLALRLKTCAPEECKPPPCHCSPCDPYPSQARPKKIPATDPPQVDLAAAYAFIPDEYVAYELNRRGVLFLRHQLYREAKWLFGESVRQYLALYGEAHPYTIATKVNEEKACQLLSQSDEQWPTDCPCVPWYEPCQARDAEHCCAHHQHGSPT